ncbi:MAG TPA: cupin domain-containing protein [bacterium]|nr:cupin domain-containing protein [bacterium]HQL63029.1 cupin domain-containing protein [bacterium]
METVHENDLDYRNGDWGVKYLFRGPKIEWGVILIKPGEKLGAHYHDEVEEHFLILEGHPTMVIDEEEHACPPGQAWRIEAPHKHNLVNGTDGPVKVVFIKTPYLPKDKTDC